MSLTGRSIVELEFYPDAPPAVVGELTTGKTVNIELWKDGDPVIIASSGCSEIDSTGQYSWSTGNIATISTTREQFHWRMSDGLGDDDNGDFVLFSNEGRDGGMPSLNDKADYIKSI